LGLEKEKKMEIQERSNRPERLLIENAKIKFMNLEGRKSDFNKNGVKNFIVVIEDENDALALIENGWNIKKKVFDEDDDMFEYRLEVKVNYDSTRPPKIYKITRRSEMLLDEEEAADLDNEDPIQVDLIITGSRWNVQGATGIKAYLSEMNFVLEESPFRGRYHDNA
jgi:hypothetical protein